MKASVSEAKAGATIQRVSQLIGDETGLEALIVRKTFLAKNGEGLVVSD